LQKYWQEVHVVVLPSSHFPDGHTQLLSYNKPPEVVQSDKQLMHVVSELSPQV
jgi:hypothetical protein